MRRFLLFVSAAAMLVAVSCAKEEVQNIVEKPVVNEEPTVEKVKWVISASAPQTKTTVDDQGIYKWVNGDAIKVFDEAGDSLGKFIVSELYESGKKADFDGVIPEGVTPKYAVYPYNANATCTPDGVISTVIPTEQDGTIASAISCATSTDGKNFKFTNVSSVVCMNVNSSDEIRYIRLEFTEPIAGDVNISEGVISGPTAMTVSVSSDEALDGTIYFVISPSIKKELTLYFRNLSGDTAVKSVTLGKDFSAGNIKKLGTVQDLNFIEGALPGIFSRQDKSKILFSRGNLKYQASTHTFSFASNQYTVLGPNKKGNNVSDPETRKTQADWIDLFCWGTSGYDYGATKFQPWSLWGANGADCGDGQKNLSLTDKSDWGYNSISNGGHSENYGWKTPTVGDWNYFFANVTGRVNSDKSLNKCYTKGTVAGIKGFFCIPDVWTCPAAVTPPASYNDKTAPWESNNWTADDWKLLEDSGMVFIPCGGWIGTGGALNGDGVQFKYWSSTYNGSLKAYLMSYGGGNFYTNDAGTRSSCASVRLIYQLPL